MSAVFAYMLPTFTKFPAIDPRSGCDKNPMFRPLCFSALTQTENATPHTIFVLYCGEMNASWADQYGSTLTSRPSTNGCCLFCFATSKSGYINQSTPRAGYYFSFTFTVIGASLLFLSKMYRRAAPPNLFLGGGRLRQHSSSSSSFRRSGSNGANESLRRKSNQEPVVCFRPGAAAAESSSSNGGVALAPPQQQMIRTVHQDVCTCPHPPVPMAPPLPPGVDQDPASMKMPKNIGRRIAVKLGLNSIPWKSNPLAEFFSSGTRVEQADGRGVENEEHLAVLKDPADVGDGNNPECLYDMDWDEYWNGCLGGCDQMDCDVCQQVAEECADCGLPFEEDDAVLDYADDHNVAVDHHIRHHHAMLPDAIDIPELPPEVFSFFLLKTCLDDLYPTICFPLYSRAIELGNFFLTHNASCVRPARLSCLTDKYTQLGFFPSSAPLSRGGRYPRQKKKTVHPQRSFYFFFLHTS